MSDRLMSALAHGSTLERVVKFQPIANPGAGNQFTFVMPGQSVGRIRAVTGTFTPSAVVATRQPSLRIDDQSTTFAAIASFATLAASQPALLSFIGDGGSGGGSAVGGIITTAMPEIILPPGHRILSAVGAMDAGDTWTNVVVWYEELLSQPFGVHELRVALEIAERLSTTGAAQEV